MKAVDDGETFEDGIWYKERWINENGIEQRIIVSFSPKYRAYQRYIRSRQIERARKSAESNKKTTTKTLTALQDSLMRSDILTMARLQIMWK